MSTAALKRAKRVRTLDWQAIKNALRLYGCRTMHVGRSTNASVLHVTWRASLEIEAIEIWIVPRSRRAGWVLLLGRDGKHIRWNHPGETQDVIDAIMVAHQKSLRNGT